MPTNRGPNEVYMMCSQRFHQIGRSEHEATRKVFCCAKKWQVFSRRIAKLSRNTSSTFVRSPLPTTTASRSLFELIGRVIEQKAGVEHSQGRTNTRQPTELDGHTLIWKFIMYVRKTMLGPSKARVPCSSHVSKGNKKYKGCCRQKSQFLIKKHVDIVEQWNR